MLNPGKFLKNAISKGAIIATLGGLAAGAVMKRQRKRWEMMEPVIDRLNAYDIGRGAGKLLQGWLLLRYPAFDLERYENMIGTILSETDRVDESDTDRARNRYILSKVLFFMEGFKLTGCRYEAIQHEARRLLKRNPRWRNLSRRDVFLGLPFEPESLIGTTHRLLVMTIESNADAKALKNYLKDVAGDGDVRDEVDFMQRLIAVTFGVQDEEEFLTLIRQWFEEYRTFEIERSHRKEAMVNKSLAVATGGLPAMAGMEAVNQVGRVILRGREKK